MILENYILTLKAQQIILEARRDKARQYPLNTKLMIEAEMCEASIDALKKEIDKTQRALIT